MRKLIVANIMSLDGYIADPGGNPMVLPMDNAFDTMNVEHLRAADTLLLGRTTFEMFQGFWPSVADDAQQTEVNREISRLDNAIAKVVVSDRLDRTQTGPWGDTTEVVRRADARARVAELKAQDGGDILVFGSHLVWNDLLAAGLVDELHLMVGPVVLGDGVPAFEGAAPDLRTVGVGQAEGSDNLIVRLAPR